MNYIQGTARNPGAAGPWHHHRQAVLLLLVAFPEAPASGGGEVVPRPHSKGLPLVAALRPHHGDRPQQGRDRVADRAW